MIYFIEDGELELLKRVEKFLYADNALKPGYIDLKRDNANLLNEIIRRIERSPAR